VVDKKKEKKINLNLMNLKKKKTVPLKNYIIYIYLSNKCDRFFVWDETKSLLKSQYFNNKVKFLSIRARMSSIFCPKNILK